MGLKNLPVTAARGLGAEPRAGSALLVDVVASVIDVERVPDTPPEIGEIPLLAGAPEQDERGAEHDEPDHIV